MTKQEYIQMMQRNGGRVPVNQDMQKCIECARVAVDNGNEGGEMVRTSMKKSAEIGGTSNPELGQSIRGQNGLPGDVHRYKEVSVVVPALPGAFTGFSLQTSLSTALDQPAVGTRKIKQIICQIVPSRVPTGYDRTSLIEEIIQTTELSIFVAGGSKFAETGLVLAIDTKEVSRGLMTDISLQQGAFESTVFKIERDSGLPQDGTPYTVRFCLTFVMGD